MRDRGYFFDVIAYRNSRRVRLMDHETRGVYREIMDEIALHGSVPNDPQKIAALINTPSDVVARVWPHIQNCLIATKADPDLLTSERMIKERRERDRI